MELYMSGPHLAPFREVLGGEDFPDGRFLVAGSLSSDDDESTAVDLRFELPQVQGTVIGVRRQY